MHKYLQRLLDTDPRIDNIHLEDEGLSTPGIWLYLKPGHICANMECGTIHEYNRADIMEQLASVVTAEEYFKDDPEGFTDYCQWTGYQPQQEQNQC